MRTPLFKTVRLVVTGMTLLGVTTCRENAELSRPNIVIILADDMGFSDLGCYGGEIETPNLDRLADNGLRYTQFYNTSRCCPTRASLLTGLYAHQAGMGWMTAADLGHPGYVGGLNKQSVTIAEILQQAGYATYMSGKWHLTLDRDMGPEGPRDNWPRQRGFDRYFGILSGGGSYFTPTTLTLDNTRIEASGDFYLTDAISDHAVDFLQEHPQKEPGSPFFLYVAYTAPHFPIHARPADIEKYRGSYRKGWAHLRAERYAHLLELGLISDSWTLSPPDSDVADWDSLALGKKREMDLRMAIYAAQIDSMDQGIGRILAALEQMGVADDTLILFLSDNGGTHEPASSKDPDLEVLGSDQSFHTYRRPWANASNVPFRLYKHWVHEGGIATPLIVHWPARIRDPGSLRSQVGHVIDLMPTALEVAGAQYPSRFGGRPILSPEGTSLAPSFLDSPINRGALFWEHESNRAVREGDWKLVSKGLEGPWELYDLSSDRTELTDLSRIHPERVENLAKMWQEWAERAHVLPLDNRRWMERVRGQKP